MLPPSPVLMIPSGVVLRWTPELPPTRSEAVPRWTLELPPTRSVELLLQHRPTRLPIRSAEVVRWNNQPIPVPLPIHSSDSGLVRT